MKVVRAGALLLTVGTGKIEELEESLFVPMRKSIDQGEWARIVLLPSQVTAEYATELKARCDGYPVEILPLPARGLEDDTDACFAHFDRAVADLRAAGFSPAEIVADYTRGTKSMSAALVLAAIRHDLRTLRYVTGERDDRGMVKAGMERIFEVSPAVAIAQKQLDMARRFAERGNYAGALALLEEEGVAAWPGVLAEAARAMRSALRFYAAWDRLDYRTAAAIDLADDAPLPEWQPLWPTPPVRAWVGGLSLAPTEANHATTAARLRLLACDLLANGERRIRDRHYEDAVLRAYRVLELVGQFRLFDHGLDSARLPPHHPAVQKRAATLAKRGSATFGRNKDGTLTAARQQVAGLLKELGDPLAPRLLEVGAMEQRLTDRNHSVLIHGFEAVGGEDEAPLRQLYDALETLLVQADGECTREHLATARGVAMTNGMPQGGGS